MIGEDLVMVCCSDLSGHVKGKAFPAEDWEKRRQRGIGWVPTNAQITAFNSIAETPFGALGDLLLVPDPAAEVNVDFGDGSPAEHWFLGDILHTDGRPWECCPRSILKAALARLEHEAGLRLKATFEMEFQFKHDDVDTGTGFSLVGYREKLGFGETLVAALRTAGIEPDSFLKEWGERQYEFTVAPTIGVTAADQAVVMREMARATAQRLGEAITFTPLAVPGGVGNGVHIHMSFVDADDAPATYDPAAPYGLGKAAGHFVAGILAHLPAILAFEAASAVSYGRLVPHRWSAAYNNLGYRDREAAVRICPLVELEGFDPAGQFNFEFRAADSSDNPYLQLAALVLAGLDGIAKELPTPKATEEDVSVWSEEQLAAACLVRLPTSLADAIAVLEANETVRSWFPAPFAEIYVKHKRGELAFLSGMSPEEICDTYSKVY